MGDTPQRKRISVEVPIDLLEHLDALRTEWGLRSRGAVLVRLLETVLPDASREPDAELELEAETAATCFDEQGALVLVARDGMAGLLLDVPSSPGDPTGDGLPAAPRTKGGIDLPGFVRRQSAQLRQSLRQVPAGRESRDPLPVVSAEQVQIALHTALEHWQELYGSSPGETVLEAAMVWLARDIWPHSDQSESRPFTWSLALDLVRGFAPSLPEGAPRFERVMVVAGLLEDPFSASTLAVRVPTLIRRFVHRFRRARKGTSFQTLEDTMTLQGALKVLQLTIQPGNRLTLPEIREAYRQVALSAHPDSGGSTDAMRRVNEAYQLLKELYRTAP